MTVPRRALVLIAACAAVYGIAVWWAASRLPESRIPMHVNAAGAIDRYGDRAEAITFLVGLGVVVLVVAVAITYVCSRLPAQYINIPHKQYWLAPERSSLLKRMVAWDVAVILGTLLLAMSFVPVSIVALSENSESSTGWIVGPIGVWLLVTVGYLVWMMARRYRPPRDRSQ